MIVRARYLLPVCGPPIEAGAVAIEGGILTRVGPASEVQPGRGETVEDLGDALLLPGLINSHCHLDFTALRSAISPSASFTEWIRRINSLKSTLDTSDYLASIRRGFAESARFGTTTILNIESFPEVLLDLGPPPLRTWWFYELIDVRDRMRADESVAGALRFFDGPQEPRQGGFGVSPHAPYTASVPLYRLAAECARRRTMPFTTHVSESREEMEMFANARGPLHDFLGRIGRPTHDCGHGSPLRHLLVHDCLPEGAILAHLNELFPSDFDLLGSGTLARTLTVVHCPGSHRYFGHPAFPLDQISALGINIALGTDSLASNQSLSMFREMRLLRQSHPALDPRRILAMATRNGARALGLDGRLGVLAPGAFADLISIPFDGTKSEIYEALFENRSPVGWMLLNGSQCSVSAAA